MKTEAVSNALNHLNLTSELHGLSPARENVSSHGQPSGSPGCLQFAWNPGVQGGLENARSPPSVVQVGRRPWSERILVLNLVHHPRAEHIFQARRASFRGDGNISGKASKGRFLLSTLPRFHMVAVLVESNPGSLVRCWTCLSFTGCRGDSLVHLSAQSSLSLNALSKPPPLRLSSLCQACRLT